LAQLTLTDFLKNLYNADEKTRLAIAKDLKTAGFLRGTPSGKASDFLILQNVLSMQELIDLMQVQILIEVILKILLMTVPKVLSGFGAF
jgi:hypothetical protein